LVLFIQDSPPFYFERVKIFLGVSENGEHFFDPETEMLLDYLTGKFLDLC
jgi:hypothetical protein